MLNINTKAITSAYNTDGYKKTKTKLEGLVSNQLQWKLVTPNHTA